MYFLKEYKTLLNTRPPNENSIRRPPKNLFWKIEDPSSVPLLYCRAYGILRECFIKYLEKVELQSYSIIKTKDLEYQSNRLVVGTRVMYYTLYLD